MMKEGLGNPVSPEATKQLFSKEGKTEKEFLDYQAKHPEKNTKEAALNFRLEKTQEKIKNEFVKELKKGLWEKLAQKKPKLAKFVNVLKTIMGGTAVNIAVRSALMTLSVGVLPASVLGGVASGAGVAYFSKRGEILAKQFDAEKIFQELDLESTLKKLAIRSPEGKYAISDQDLIKSISSVRGLFQYKKLFLQRQRVFGKKEKLIDALEGMEKELETRKTLEIIEKIPENERTKERIARELIKLEENRLHGSDLTKGELDMSEVANEFINSKKEQAGKTGKKAALIGGVFGGAVSGIMTWATMPAHGFGAGHLNHGAALKAALQNPDFQSVVGMAKNGASVGEVKHMLYQYGIDPLYKPAGSELNVWQNIVSTLKTDSSIDASKAVYNMLSYPGQLNPSPGAMIDPFNQWVAKAIHVNLLGSLATTDKGLLGISGASKTALGAAVSGIGAALLGTKLKFPSVGKKITTEKNFEPLKVTTINKTTKPVKPPESVSTLKGEPARPPILEKSAQKLTEETAIPTPTPKAPKKEPIRPTKTQPEEAKVNFGKATKAVPKDVVDLGPEAITEYLEKQEIGKPLLKDPIIEKSAGSPEISSTKSPEKENLEKKYKYAKDIYKKFRTEQDEKEWFKLRDELFEICLALTNEELKSDKDIPNKITSIFNNILVPYGTVYKLLETIEGSFSFERCGLPDLAAMHDDYVYSSVRLKKDEGGVLYKIEMGGRQFILPLPGISYYYSPGLYNNFYYEPKGEEGKFLKIIKPAEVEYDDTAGKYNVITRGVAEYPNEENAKFTIDDLQAAENKLKELNENRVDEKVAELKEKYNSKAYREDPTITSKQRDQDRDDRIALERQQEEDKEKAEKEISKINIALINQELKSGKEKPTMVTDIYNKYLMKERFSQWGPLHKLLEASNIHWERCGAPDSATMRNSSAIFEKNNNGLLIKIEIDEQQFVIPLSITSFNNSPELFNKLYTKHIYPEREKGDFLKIIKPAEVKYDSTTGKYEITRGVAEYPEENKLSQ